MLYFRADGYGNLFYCVYQSGNERKAEYVDDKENGVGHIRVYIRKNGESAVVVWAYEEHIERVVHTVCEEYVVHNYVHSERYGGKHRENYHAPSEEALVQVVAVVRHEEYAYNELKAVMHHRLNIDTDDIYENIAGVYHNRKTREEGKRCHISNNCVAEFTFLRENKYGQKVHRRGAELEGEGIPLVIPGCCYTVAAHREDRLLVHLEKNYNYPENEEYSAKRFIVAILEFPYHKSREQNSKRERNKMPRAEKLRLFHCCAQKMYYFFKTIHKNLCYKYARFARTFYQIITYVKRKCNI